MPGAKLFVFAWKGKAAGCSGFEKVSEGVGGWKAGNEGCVGWNCWFGWNPWNWNCGWFWAWTLGSCLIGIAVPAKNGCVLGVKDVLGCRGSCVISILLLLTCPGVAVGLNAVVAVAWLGETVGWNIKSSSFLAPLSGSAGSTEISFWLWGKGVGKKFVVGLKLCDPSLTSSSFLFPSWKNWKLPLPSSKLWRCSKSSLFCVTCTGPGSFGWVTAITWVGLTLGPESGLVWGASDGLELLGTSWNATIGWLLPKWTKFLLPCGLNLPVSCDPNCPNGNISCRGCLRRGRDLTVWRLALVSSGMFSARARLHTNNSTQLEKDTRRWNIKKITWGTIARWDNSYNSNKSQEMCAGHAPVFTCYMIVMLG